MQLLHELLLAVSIGVHIYTRMLWFFPADQSGKVCPTIDSQPGTDREDAIRVWGQKNHGGLQRICTSLLSSMVQGYLEMKRIYTYVNVYLKLLTIVKSSWGSSISEMIVLLAFTSLVDSLISFAIITATFLQIFFMERIN